MKAIKFPESNVVYGANQPEYIPLFCYYEKDGYSDAAISCWKLSLWEKIVVLFTGKIWLEVLLFHKPFPPVRVMAKIPFVEPEGE